MSSSDFNPRVPLACLVGLLLALCAPACRQSRAPLRVPGALRIGFGLPSGQNPIGGVRQAARLLTLEGLVSFARDGRPRPWLADGWTISGDGRSLRLHITPGVRFHDGSPATADVLGEALRQQLPAYMGPSFADITSINASSPLDLDIQTARRSNFVLESLDAGLASPTNLDAGTGPYALAPLGEDDVLAVQANPDYRDGAPAIQRVEFHGYQTDRSAWADMLRGSVDMLYEVHGDAVASLAPTPDIHVFTNPRSYAWALLLNVSRAPLRSPRVRQQLNEAIDRQAIVENVLGGRGRSADTPVVPDHWASSKDGPRFAFHPVPLAAPLTLTCIFADDSLERMALAVQRQLLNIGVDLQLEKLPLDELTQRATSGQFDVLLGGMLAGPTMVRQQWFFGTGERFNWGHYSDTAVDHALGEIRDAASDTEYRDGVAAYRAAIVNNPPAVFIAWSERTRAVSARYAVHGEPGRDVFSSLRLWRPALGASTTGQD